MPRATKKPKKSKKTKLSKGPPEKVFKLLTADEMKIRVQRQANRLSDLRICHNFIDDAVRQVNKLNKTQLIVNKWQNFLACNPLPKAYIPPEVRLFFIKMKHMEEQSTQSYIDWPLAVNERSILTQNIFRKDLTRKNLETKLGTEFGIEYNSNINDCLNVIRRIEYLLDDEVEKSKCNESILLDIKQLKMDVQQKISQLFDRYTYRILSSEDAYMNSVDAITTDYCFSADHFQFQLWALKNVAIIFSQLDEPRLVANFQEINLSLHIPSTMLHENLCVRAIRMNFDHLSENSKSFSQPKTASAQDFIANTGNLNECLNCEWLLQSNIQNRVRNEMIEKRLEYEEKLKEFEEAEAKKGKKKASAADEAKGKANTKSKKNIKKPAKEPPIMGPDVFPDIYMDFLEEEQMQYEEFLNSSYHPDKLELEYDEINLRQYLILGGILQLYYVQKPEQLKFDFNRFNMTWHHNDSKLSVNKDMFIPPNSMYLSRRMTQLMSRMSLRRLTKTAPETERSKILSIDPECPWFVMTITLPEYLCYWDEPMVCHYETVTEEMKNKTKPTSSVALEKTQLSDAADKEHNGEMDTIHKLGFNDTIFSEAPTSLALSAANPFQKARSSNGTLNINNFPLSTHLNRDQVHHLERHCLPRIISSFKFPLEIREEELEALNINAKGKIGTLMRKQANISENDPDKTLNRIFKFDDKQNNPERFFVVYTHEELLQVFDYLESDELNQIQDIAEPKTFLDLINILNDIKWKYKQHPLRSLKLKSFTTKVKLENKYIKRQLEKQHQESFQDASNAKNIAQRKSLERIEIQNQNEIKNTPNNDESSSFKNHHNLKHETSKFENVKHSLKPKTKYEEEAPETPNEFVTYSHWTTKHILDKSYDKEKRTIIIKADRLGNIGLAFKRYEHFPFKYWSLAPSENDPENEVILTLETQHVRCVLCCTATGIKGHVMEPTKKFVRNPKMYLVIEEPMNDYKEFKKIFKNNHLNIFAEEDASFYIENGYFSQKHLAAELHTYCCMALHSTQMKFEYSQWNRLAQRRDIILKFVQFKDSADNVVEVRLTPEEAFFVEISELCSDDLDVIKLNYTLTWRNIGSYTDLHHLINAMYPAATEMRCKNSKLICCIRELLAEIRPLSFS